jgi:siroheme synthase (precorrin-2 oxidase/ferrochelatase)
MPKLINSNPLQISVYTDMLSFDAAQTLPENLRNVFKPEGQIK